jgi:hypothetical protein
LADASVGSRHHSEEVHWMSMTANVHEQPAPTTLDARPLGGSVLAGLIASLCCGGSLLFGSIGLGAFYGSLGLARYIPQALALGTITILVINWVFYRRRAARPNCDCASLRRSMVLSAGLGLFAMSAGFVLLEWLNHGVVNAGRSHGRAAGSALLPWTSNQNLLYAALALVAGLGVITVLPLPSRRSRRIGLSHATPGS